jgi:FKBP-type peptidyl-prolyl cis-trans isomerase 2
MKRLLSGEFPDFLQPPAPWPGDHLRLRAGEKVAGAPLVVDAERARVDFNPPSAGQPLRVRTQVPFLPGPSNDAPC